MKRWPAFFLPEAGAVSICQLKWNQEENEKQVSLCSVRPPFAPMRIVLEPGGRPKLTSTREGGENELW